MNGLINVLQLSTIELDELIACAEDIIENPDKYAHKCDGKKLATMFYEPSTRTRLSFEAAMCELGGKVLSVANAGNSSAAKGETIADTARILSCYADVIAMRHNMEGAAYVADINASVPVINAGDGGHMHPTQTLADLLTIHREKGRFDNLTIGFCGDLKYGRTVHSLIAAMSRYKNIKIVGISPESLKLPEYVMDEYITPNNIEYVCCDNLEEAIPELDVLYMTRVQVERLEDEDREQLSDEELKEKYILRYAKLANAKNGLIILHPLPRVDEIATDVDKYPGSAYFRQALNGKYMRMALILKLIGETESNELKRDLTVDYDKCRSEGICCHNSKCITVSERELPQAALLLEEEVDKYKKYKCIYCDSPIIKGYNS